jgi:hypothetical protein
LPYIREVEVQKLVLKVEKGELICLETVDKPLNKLFQGYQVSLTGLSLTLFDETQKS